ncbi:hypothetical protein FHG87_008422 [Trinorchestia longiramus]|nr:hypothetical protein FHG87_008422 [Trinorchestia longiramus]
MSPGYNAVTAALRCSQITPPPVQTNSSLVMVTRVLSSQTHHQGIVFACHNHYLARTSSVFCGSHKIGTNAQWQLSLRRRRRRSVANGAWEDTETEAGVLYLQQREKPPLLLPMASSSLSSLVNSRFSWTPSIQRTSFRLFFLVFLCLTQSAAKLISSKPNPLTAAQNLTSTEGLVIKSYPSLLSSIYSQSSGLTSTSIARVGRSLGGDLEHGNLSPDNASVASLNSSFSGDPTPRAPESCEVSNIKCALRSGCGMALQKYMLDCADLINGNSEECDVHCKDSLLILTSTSEGRALMECTCSDQYCRETKSRVEVCREEVVQARAHTGSYSCRLAHLVCTADTSCATAISYYDKYCRRMFSGRSCSARCNNSIAILQRQEKAARLETCKCDGSEPFDCTGIKRNMARLCFHQMSEEDKQQQEEETNEIDTSRLGDKSAASGCRASDIVLIKGLAFIMTVLFNRLILPCF